MHLINNSDSILFSTYKVENTYFLQHRNIWISQRYCIIHED